MPLYEYRCEACNQHFEVIRKFSDPELTVCNLCGQGPVRRLLSSPAIQFKGTGWYITDYSQKGKAGAESTSTPGSADSKAAGSDSAGGPAKADAPTKADTPAPATKPAASDT